MFRLVVVSCLLALAVGANIHRNGKLLRNLKRTFPSGRIVGGAETTIETVPWQVAIEYNQLQFCGGSIIGKTFILTAARCVSGFTASDITIRTGSSDHEQGGTLLQAKTLNIPPDYDPATNDFDVAVIELEKEIESGDTSKVILPVEENAEPDSKISVLVSGWGTLTEGGETPEKLYSVTVPIVERAACETAYGDPNPITVKMICAGEAEKGPCQGDFGGPAVTGTGDDLRQVGIVSWSNGCAKDDPPTVYTNIANTVIRNYIKSIANV